MEVLKLAKAYHVCYVRVALGVHLHPFFFGGMAQKQAQSFRDLYVARLSLTATTTTATTAASILSLLPHDRDSWKCSDVLEKSRLFATRKVGDRQKSAEL